MAALEERSAIDVASASVSAAETIPSAAFS
jgi:hypothetical protein